jgi:hypothetical protein
VICKTNAEDLSPNSGHFSALRNGRNVPKPDVPALISREVKARRRQRAADPHHSDAVGPGMARGDDVVAVGDGLRQVGDGMHAQTGKRGEIHLAVGAGGPVHDGVLAPAGLEPERVGAGTAIEEVVAGAAKQRVVAGAAIEIDGVRIGGEVRGVGAAVEHHFLHVGAELGAAVGE